MESKRLFLAIPCSEETGLVLRQNALSLKTFGRGRLMKEETYHVTMVFIGETDRLSDVEESLKELAIPKFSLAFTGPAYFKGAKGLMVYQGVKKSEILQETFNSLIRSLDKRTFSDLPSGYTPHVTLARRYVPDEKDLWLEKARASFIRPKPQPVDRIYLYESKLSAQGPTYIPLAYQTLA
jgi:2'-5' RNA ligase